MLNRVMATAAILAGLFSPVARAVAAQVPSSSWSPGSVPAPPGAARSRLEGVSCAGSQCVAVGTAALSTGQPPLVEVRTSGSWQQVTLPPVPGAGLVGLGSVSCPAPGQCVAVGYQQAVGSSSRQALVEVLAGGTWSMAPLPQLGASEELTGVSCSAPASCAAVGWYTAGGRQQALVETLSAGGWAVVPAAEPGVRSDVLQAVSCTQSGGCTAVGYYQAATGAMHPLIETQSGTAWYSVGVASRGGGDNVLDGVSCPSATSCAAVGWYFNGHANQTLVDVLANGRWVPVTASPDASVANNQLSAVACPAVGQCTAVGSYSDGQRRQALSLFLAAGSWQLSRPRPGGGDRALSALSCTSQLCNAVGWQALPLSPVTLPLAASGIARKWATVGTAVPQASDAELLSVSCPATSQCVAVGDTVSLTGLPAPLVEVLSAGLWSPEAAPAPVVPGLVSGAPAYLQGVSCPALGQCVAVGYYVDSAGVAQPLIETLSAGAWAVVASPGVGTSAATYLQAVSCPAVGACTAVGYYVGTSGKAVPIAVTGPSNGWSLQALPMVGTAGELLAVSCPGTGTCTAVGTASGGQGTRGLVETLASGSWSGAGAAATASASDMLSSVSCPGTGRCLAVGSSTVATGDLPLVEEPAAHGAVGAGSPPVWTVVGGPAGGGGGAGLSAVSCVSPASCAATGYVRSAVGAGDQAFVAVLTGGTWVTASPPTPSGQAAQLLGTSCTAALACTAVGWYQDAQERYPLVESGDLAPPPPRHTRVSVVASAGPVLTGVQLTYTATVTPVPTAGSVSFIADGAALEGCTSLPVSAGGSATCTVVYGTPGTRLVQASYSGSQGFTPSSSKVLEEIVRLPAPGYWLATTKGVVFGVGAARAMGGPGPAGGKVVGIAAAPGGTGYWVATADGTVSAFGTARFEGDLPALHVRVKDIVAIAATPDGAGYWLVGRDGGFFAFGDARFHGSLPARHVHVHDIVGMASAPDGAGYLLVGADGGVFDFGTARYHGSLPASHHHVHDVRALVVAPSGAGYLLVGADGGAFTFGRGARYFGSLPARHVKVRDIVGLAMTPDGKGYYMAASDGRVYGFGDASPALAQTVLAASGPVVAIAGT